MVGPLKTENQSLIAAYEELLLGTEVRLWPVDRSILEEAARLRAKTFFRIPDAIHAATAALAGCDLLVTNDLAFRSLTTVRVEMLKDAIEG